MTAIKLLQVKLITSYPTHSGLRGQLLTFSLVMYPSPCFLFCRLTNPKPFPNTPCFLVFCSPMNCLHCVSILHNCGTQMVYSVLAEAFPKKPCYNLFRSNHISNLNHSHLMGLFPSLVESCWNIAKPLETLRKANILSKFHIISSMWDSHNALKTVRITYTIVLVLTLWQLRKSISLTFL